MKQATIIGSGLVGSLWAVYLSKQGYKVNVFERRTDMRKAKISAGKSINLAMSFRGWKALDEMGIGDEIRKISIPMYGRTMHALDGKTTYQPYGINNQAIYSVSRGDINCKLMDIAEREGNTQIKFSEECIGADLKNGTVDLKNTETGKLSEHTSDVVFGTDGAFSAIRYNAFQKTDRFTYSQNYIEDGYREILLPANADGSYKLEKNTLHIWPRGRFMLIALPNFDGSFTCTLFMPFENHEHCFNNLTSKEKVNNFFKSVFPDFFEMMPNIADAWEDHPLSSLAIIRCFPWTNGKAALMGDAAHATVPFFGQGMNAGFEDCSALYSLMKKHNENWTEIFKEYEVIRKPNGDAVQDLSMLNYIVMRDKVADPVFLLQQKVERRMAELYPGNYFPMYSMVSFSDIEYQVALTKGKEQDKIILDLILQNNITNDTSPENIDKFIHRSFGEKIKTKLNYMNEAQEKLVERLTEKYKSIDQDVNIHMDGLVWAKQMTYWDYIQTEALLGLQIQRTTLPDEMVFIMYHQINELLFKMILWEMDQVAHTENIVAPKFTKHLDRISRYFDMLSNSFTIMGDGMDIDQYMKFRNTLTPASGFQSAQYRLIEFGSTELINLIDYRFRATIDRNTPYEHAYEHLYWQAAGKDHATGKKNPLLQNFENKYKHFFLGKMEEYNTINLYTKFKSLPEKEKTNKDLINAMRHYDHTVNIGWVMNHYNAAAKYLDSGPKKAEATGGSDWHKYMHPKYQRRIFFPSLWSEEELKNWGVDNLEGYKKL